MDDDMAKVMRYFALISTAALVIFAFVVVREAMPAWKGEQEIAGRPWREGLFIDNCASCHGQRGEGRAAGRAPAIGTDAFLALTSDDMLQTTIKQGRPGTDMNPMGRDSGGVLSDRLIDEIVAYLRSQQQEPRVELPEEPVEGVPERGRELYAANCAECHGLVGQGRVGPALNNEVFQASASDQYIKETIARGRPGTPMGAWGRGYGGVKELSPQEIGDIVAYIRTWKK